MCAGLAVHSGMELQQAWKAITVNPAEAIGIADRVGTAEAIGIADRVGSLEPGKDADIVIWTADPLQTIGGEAWMTIVDGKIVYQA